MPSALTDMRRISGRAETVDRHRDCDLLLTRYRGREIGIARVVFGRTVERIDTSVRFFIEILIFAVDIQSIFQYSHR